MGKAQDEYLNRLIYSANKDWQLVSDLWMKIRKFMRCKNQF